MRKLPTSSKTPKYRVIAAVVGLAIICGLSAASLTFADDATPKIGERLISVHDRGVEKGVLTTATTVRMALSEAGIAIDANDLVEPSLDEELVASNYHVNIYRARPVIISDGEISRKVLSAYQTPKQIVEHAGVVLHDEDETAMTMGADMVSNGGALQIDVNRATAFTLILYGTTTQVYSQETTVAGMMQSKNIRLSENDTLSVSKDQELVDGMTIEIWRNGKQTVVEEQNIDFSVEKIQDANRDIGYREVKTLGESGKKTVTYEVVMKNGIEESRKEIQSVVTKQPKAQVEIAGAKVPNTFSGSFGQALAKLRSCEGSYTSNTGNGYYGAYQYDIQTWGGYMGYSNASVAPPGVQDQKVWETYQRRGWQPWPSCSRSQGLQDIYR